MREYIIADNQDITKAGILFLLGGLKDVGNISEADNRAELIKELRAYPEAVVILDYTLFDFAGAEELLILTERFPKANWILFSDELSEEFVKRILYSSQQFSFVMKDNSKEEITSALQCAMHKERFICNHISNMLIGKKDTTPVENILTNTEKIILKEIALGKTTKEIAAERNLSFHTINSHRKNIFRKLEVNNVHEATKYAMRAGIVDLAEYYI
ncbi:response regulator transcription factor [uncultured Bacteroides sp.]|uniref:response regulator transcription factor n=1 Tax=uncultured Bacteroides sp. TaxID=162156 RepID=UPI002AA774BE|nr:response regulator transcription factor [uncultured Bacteroides sp.]